MNDHLKAPITDQKALIPELIAQNSKQKHWISKLKALDLEQKAQNSQQKASVLSLFAGNFKL